MALLSLTLSDLQTNWRICLKHTAWPGNTCS